MGRGALVPTPAPGAQVVSSAEQLQEPRGTLTLVHVEIWAQCGVDPSMALEAR